MSELHQQVISLMEKTPARVVSLQELSDCGLNPFAVKLLTESAVKHPDPKPVCFLYDGCKVLLAVLPVAPPVAGAQ